VKNEVKYAVKHKVISIITLHRNQAVKDKKEDMTLVIDYIMHRLTHHMNDINQDPLLLLALEV
jgi:hypothetical protein